MSKSAQLAALVSKRIIRHQTSKTTLGAYIMGLWPIQIWYSLVHSNSRTTGYKLPRNNSAMDC